MNKEGMRQKLRGAFEKIGKYKYTVLILLLGVGLMLFPNKSPEPVQQETATPDNANLEQRLEALLRQVEGAGDVQVLLTLKEGVSYEYQTDVRSSKDENGSELQKETVLLSGGGSETPVTVRTIYPVYQGAVVLCQGADSAAVRLDIVHIVSSLTGLGSDKISVIKMKDN